MNSYETPTLIKQPWTNIILIVMLVALAGLLFWWLRPEPVGDAPLANNPPVVAPLPYLPDLVITNKPTGTALSNVSFEAARDTGKGGNRSQAVKRTAPPAHKQKPAQSTSSTSSTASHGTHASAQAGSARASATIGQTTTSATANAGGAWASASAGNGMATASAR